MRQGLVQSVVRASESSYQSPGSSRFWWPMYFYRERKCFYHSLTRWRDYESDVVLDLRSKFSLCSVPYSVLVHSSIKEICRPSHDEKNWLFDVLNVVSDMASEIIIFVHNYSVHVAWSLQRKSTLIPSLCILSQLPGTAMSQKVIEGILNGKEFLY